MAEARETLIRQRNRATLLILVSLVSGMTGLSFAAVPLYRIYCSATGFGGTTRWAKALPDKVAADLVTVRFDAQTAPGLDWEFRPLKDAVVVHPGAQGQVFFRAVNRSATRVTAHAVYNVTPAKVGIYFDKLQCFCFANQTLGPGESVDMGVAFFVDPDLLTDSDTSEVRSITLSYTMFRAADATSSGVRAAPAPAIPASFEN